jgi:hypothetical protein
MKILVSILLAGVLLAATGCKKKTPPPEVPAPQSETNQPAAAPAQPAKTAPPKAPPTPPAPAAPAKKLPMVP